MNWLKAFPRRVWGFAYAQFYSGTTTRYLSRVSFVWDDWKGLERVIFIHFWHSDSDPCEHLEVHNHCQVGDFVAVALFGKALESRCEWRDGKLRKSAIRPFRVRRYEAFRDYHAIYHVKVGTLTVGFIWPAKLRADGTHYDQITFTNENGLEAA